MSSYRFRLIDGEAVREFDFEHKDDIEALKTAEALARHFDVELSHGGQFLALIHKKGYTAARDSSDVRPSAPG